MSNDKSQTCKVSESKEEGLDAKEERQETVLYDGLLPAIENLSFGQNEHYPSK